MVTLRWHHRALQLGWLVLALSGCTGNLAESDSATASGTASGGDTRGDDVRPNASMSGGEMGTTTSNGGDSSGSQSDGNLETTSGGDGGYGVYVTDWVKAIEADFDVQAVTELFVGGSEKDGNFINRGDIEVYFTTSDTIEVEYRKFMVARTRAEAEGNLAKFQLWSWAKWPPVPPRDLQDTPELECNNGHWNDGCHIRAWYEGQRQPDRIGMDFRVYLPEGWAGTLAVATEDNMAEKEVYPDRGNITIKGGAGHLEVYGEGGMVNIARAENTPEVVGCDETELKKCQDSHWADIGGDECTCDQFGTILVDMRYAANVNINLNHNSMLMQMLLSNNDDTLKETSDPKCEAFFDCDSMEDCDAEPLKNLEEPWRIYHSANVPEQAQRGIGFSVTVDVQSCQETSFIEHAGDFGSPKSEPRGFVNVCAEAGGRCPEIVVP